MGYRTSLAFGVLTFGVVATLTGPGFAQDVGITPLRQDLAARTFYSACGSCHHRGPGKAPFSAKILLSVSTPDAVVQFILFGKAPEIGEGQMPGFGNGLTDANVARQTVWLRGTIKPAAEHR